MAIAQYSIVVHRRREQQGPHDRGLQARLRGAARGRQGHPGVGYQAEANEAALKDLAKLTGGQVFDARKRSLYSVFKDIRAYQ